tara:strand:+ start:510 stop:788 length:279 start_codon:yes stop_codon:yes gene_type:complete
MAYVKFSEPLPVGIVITEGRSPAFEYEMIGLRRYENAQGRTVCLAEWVGYCADCGEEFTFEASAHRLPQNRRCDRHKTKGRKVPRHGKRKEA